MEEDEADVDPVSAEMQEREFCVQGWSRAEIEMCIGRQVMRKVRRWGPGTMTALSLEVLNGSRNA